MMGAAQSEKSKDEDVCQRQKIGRGKSHDRKMSRRTILEDEILNGAHVAACTGKMQGRAAFVILKGY